MRCVKENGKYYCHDCASRLFGSEKISKSRLKNGKSFEQWCVENNRQDVLERWDYELNSCLPSEITFGTNKKYYFKCPKELHKSELKSIGKFTSGQEGSLDCKACNSFAQWGIDNLGDDFLEKYWDYDKNNELGIDPWNISKSCEKPKIWINCQEKNYHSSYDTSPDSFVSRNCRCPYCVSKKVHPLDSLGKLLEDKDLLHLWSDKNKRLPYEYSLGSNKEVWWKCPEGIHADYQRKIEKSNKYNFRCPECQYSKGEEVISNYFIGLGLIKINDEDYISLDSNSKIQKIYYIPQKKFDGLIGLGNGLLSYDFYLPNLQHNLLIEYDGIFHYEPIKYYKNEPIKYAEERLRKQQEHDRLKDEYAQNNNIKLLRIPYWDFDNIESILSKELNLIEVVGV